MQTHAALTLRSDHLKVSLLPEGASLVAVRFTDTSRNLVLGFKDPNDAHRQDCFAGPLVGPIANRLAGGRLVIAQTPYQMIRNEAGRHTLHSGPTGLHSHLWNTQQHGPDAVTFSTRITHMSDGLPGTRVIDVRYSLESTSLTLSINATSDLDTVMNIAPHAYWNLDGQPDVSQHHLQIAAQHYLPVDDEMIPTGAVEPVADTAFDFQTPCAVPLTSELDVNFCLSPLPHRPLTRAAQLTGADGTSLTLDTTAPGLQVYNGSQLPRAPSVMDRCPPLAPYSAIALEPQGWPDAPNQTTFPSISLRAGQTYRQTSVFTLSRPQSRR